MSHDSEVGKVWQGGARRGQGDVTVGVGVVAPGPLPSNWMTGPAREGGTKHNRSSLVTTGTRELQKRVCGGRKYLVVVKTSRDEQLGIVDVEGCEG